MRFVLSKASPRACRRLLCPRYVSLAGASWTVRIMSTDKTSHLERTAREPREKELLEVKLSSVHQINDRVRLFRLSLPDPIKVRAGQWLDTYVPATPGAGGFTVTSPPSAASASTDPYFELAVQASPENPHAAWLWRPIEEILHQTLHVRVGGSFVYPPPGSEAVKRVVLVAGGVGVNPLVSMLGEMVERGEGADVRVLYGSKMPKGGWTEVPFLERIGQMFRQGKITGSLDVFLTGMHASAAAAPETAVSPERTPEWLHGASTKLHEGRMAPGQVREAIDAGDGDANGTVVYICGPPTMTDEMAEATSQGPRRVIDAKRVMTEKWW